MSEETVLLPEPFPHSEWTSLQKYSFLQGGYKSLDIYSSQQTVLCDPGHSWALKKVRSFNGMTLFFFFGPDSLIQKYI